MSLKLSLIFVCGLFAFSIRVDATPAATVLQQALAEAAPDFPLALRASGEIFTAMALDALANKETNAIVPIWKSIITTLTNPKGAETFRLIMAKVKDIIQDDNSQQTLINIFATLYTCLSYEVGENGVKFPWKEMRRTIYGPNKKVFSVMANSFWEISRNPSTKDKFAIIVNFGEDTLQKAEQQGSSSVYKRSARDVDNLAEGDLMGLLGTGNPKTELMVDSSGNAVTF